MGGEVELLGERIAEQAAHLDAATHLLLANLREFDARGGWHLQGAKTCAHWLAWRVGWDLVTARQRVHVAKRLGKFPATDDALRRGELSYSKVRAIVRVATPANEAYLLECARLSTASQLENLTRKYARVQAHDKEASPRDDEQRRYVRRRDTHDGMVKIEAVLHPEEAELVWTMLDHAAKTLTREPPAPSRNDATDSPAIPLSNASAESQAVAHRTDATEALVAAPSNASAESQAVAHRTDATEALVAPPSNASAESPASSMGTDTAEAPAAPPINGSAESPAPAMGTDAAEAPAARLFDDSSESPAPHPGSRVAQPPVGRPPSVLRQAADATKRAFNRADALMAVAQAYLRGERPNRTPIDVMITIPSSTLRDGAVEAIDAIEAGLMGGSCIGAQAARRISCDAGVIEVIEGEDGVPLSVGRKRRTISGTIKRALLKRDTSCTFPGCDNRVFLEGHHVRHWADGGETSLSNTILICSHHHHYVHEYGYLIELSADQRPRFRDPHGRLVEAVPARPTAPDLGWPRLRAEHRALAIDAETIACEWDGTPMPYGTVVGQLVRIDGLS